MTLGVSKWTTTCILKRTECNCQLRSTETPKRSQKVNNLVKCCKTVRTDKTKTYTTCLLLDLNLIQHVFQLLKRKGTVQHFKGGSRLQAKMTASIKKTNKPFVKIAFKLLEMEDYLSKCCQTVNASLYLNSLN